MVSGERAVRSGSGKVESVMTDDARAAGLARMAEVYNFDIDYPEQLTPYQTATIEHLFAEVWNRSGLSMRDRRLLLIGISSVVGTERLLEIQFSSALDNGELNPDEIRELTLLTAYYAGWPHGSAAAKAAEVAIAAPRRKRGSGGDSEGQG
jgi:4-carboxymuconolactone decarboxylase